jgi:predicted amidohydrolase YtcJ
MLRHVLTNGLLLLLVPVMARGQRAAPDVVLTGGKVFTADSARPWAQAVAIRGGRIAAVGTTEEIERLADAFTRRIDLGGRTVVPGFNDAHAHLGAPLPGMAFGTSGEPVPDPPLATVLDSLTAITARAPQGTWLRTSIDATLLDDPRARRWVLDSVAPRHPVWLGANTGHGVILNTAALRALRIADDAPDPAGGFYERGGAPYPGRGQGRVTGLLHEYAGWNASQALRSARPDSVLVAAMRRDGQRAAGLGITSLQNVAIHYDAATTVRVQKLAALPLRIRIIPMPRTDAGGRRTDEWRRAAADAAAEPWEARPRPEISGIKWILDGTGIERLAVLRAPYADRPGWTGRANFSPDTVRAMLAEALAAGEQPVLHAIGDSTIALVLASMESLAPDSVWRRLRPRLEHAEWLTPDLRSRARRLGIIVVQNPVHFSDPPELVRARFGDRGGGYQPFASLAAEGIPLAIGSDGPMDPFLNLMFAVTHPVNPCEALSMEQAVSAYTRGSAFAEHREHEKGTLAPGMLADLAVLSRDIFGLAPEDLPGTASVLTLVGGVVVHDSLTGTSAAASAP